MSIAALPFALPRLIAHRGASGVAPENTLVALRRAAELGARWVEFDVKLSADGVPILLHDDKVDRTTNGRGRAALMAWSELRRLDAGAWFAPAFDGEPVPAFADALILCRELGLGMNIELKPCRGRARETATAALRTLQATLGETPDKVLISSFEASCLEVVHELAPALPRGYLANRVPRQWRAEVALYGCATLHVAGRWLRTAQIAEIVAAGVPLLAYTVNAPHRAQALWQAGVTSLFTDRIDLLAGLPEAAQ